MVAAAAPRIPRTPPHVSVNRVRIVELPGVAIDETVRGAQAYHLFSAPAVICYARKIFGPHRLPAGCLEDTQAAHHRLPRYVETCLRKRSPGAWGATWATSC